MEPIHGTQPIVFEETAGKKAYCQCGHTAKAPYCDGAHSRMQTGLAPIVYEINEKRKVAICQCHRSAKLPFCDGTHKNPPVHT
jgi:CDGSH-type Zn-finger protein